MKVLWFCNSKLASQKSKGYNGGGWMRSLRDAMQKKQMELGIACIGDENNKSTIDGITYYEIKYKKPLAVKLKDKFLGLGKAGHAADSHYVKMYMDVISEFQPDIIHIWGTENNYGLLIPHTSVPCVIHIQGIISPYQNFLLPPSYSSMTYCLKDGITKLWKNRKALKSWGYQSSRECGIFAKCHYFMGRTEWDKGLTDLLSPNAAYFKCNELLRAEFMNAAKWKGCNNGKLKLLSIISSPWYKGTNVILRTAALLKTHTQLDFEWNVFGVSQSQFIEKHEKIQGKKVNVYWRGIADADTLVAELQHCSIFVHPSYIDNSPNSVCEAQYLGVPVIATNVGGVSSLIENNETGILVPAHDAYMLAYKIKQLYQDAGFQERISKGAIMQAEERHNVEKIVSGLITIYKKIGQNKNGGTLK